MAWSAHLDFRRVCWDAGYAELKVPLTPGSRVVEVSTWRPHGSLNDELRRFFVGGGASLEDPTYVGVPTDHDGGPVSAIITQMCTA